MPPSITFNQSNIVRVFQYCNNFGSSTLYRSAFDIFAKYITLDFLLFSKQYPCYNVQTSFDLHNFDVQYDAIVVYAARIPCSTVSEQARSDDSHFHTRRFGDDHTGPEFPKLFRQWHPQLSSRGPILGYAINNSTLFDRFP